MVFRRQRQKACAPRTVEFSACRQEILDLREEPMLGGDLVLLQGPGILEPSHREQRDLFGKYAEGGTGRDERVDFRVQGIEAILTVVFLGPAEGL